MVEGMEKQDLLVQLQKVYECGICLNVVCNPKQLTCDHAYCQKCLDKVLRFAPDGSAKIKCPNGCDLETTISATETTNDLHSNFMLKSALDLVAGRKSADDQQGRCSACSRHAVKYCIKCHAFRCAECTEEHDAPDENNSMDSIVAVNFCTSSDGTGVVFCQKHRAAVEYVCCETQQLVCTYCMHRDPLTSRSYESLDDIERSLKDMMQQKISENLDFVKRKEDSFEDIKSAKEGLEKELEQKKGKCLVNYFSFLVKEEQKVLNEFKRISDDFLMAFTTIDNFKEYLKNDEFNFRLSWYNIRKQMKTVCMDSINTIPGVKVYLENNTFSGASPLGTLKGIYCNGNSCKNFQGQFNIEQTELHTSAAKFQDLVKFVEALDDQKSCHKGYQPGISTYSISKTKYEGDEKEQNEESQPRTKCMKMEEKEERLEANSSEGILIETTCEKVMDTNSVEKHHCKPQPLVTFPLKSIKITSTCLFKVCNVSKIYDEPVFSEPITMQEFVFELKLIPTFRRENDLKRKYAGLFLCCSYSGFNSTWSLPCEFEFTLKNTVGDDLRRGGKTPSPFSESKDRFGWPCFIKWEEIFNQRYLVNDVLTIEAVITCQFAE